MPADYRIEVHRIAGQHDRVMEARHAELQPAQEVIVRDFPALFRHDFLAAQARHLDRRGQARFQAGDLALELRNQARSARRMVGSHRIVIEHEFDKLALGQHWREPRDGQDKVALEHRAQALEQAPAFLVNGEGNGVGER
uniref:hypothetical protein n=1 Tax=Pseudomonas putida TaxID=303 RepID=UPI00155DD30E|nr:hypothetical protein [Pseudomonas putida]